MKRNIRTFTLVRDVDESGVSGVDTDESHFATCAQSDEWRKSR